jgi:hypothetical protein
MNVGNPSHFAIESIISEAFERPSFLAIGYFVIHILGRRYGVATPDATLLACSFDRVNELISSRNAINARCLDHLSAGWIADAYRVEIFGADSASLESVPDSELLLNFINQNIATLQWAPDGDEAFDDGSFILQMNVGKDVRLIGFRCKSDGLHDPSTLREIRIDQDSFYDILETWSRKFLLEWKSLPKNSG